MEIAGLVLGLLGVVLGLVSIALVFAIERARAPKLVIEAGDRHWPSDSGLFAHIAVSNCKPNGRLARFFHGTTVTNCRVSLEFVRDGVSVLGPIPGRWSGASEPQSPADFPDSYRWDLAATGEPEQIAIARTADGVAHAFSAESYVYEWKRPGWELDPGTYDVVVALAATEAMARATLRLVVTGAGALRMGLPA